MLVFHLSPHEINSIFGFRKLHPPPISNFRAIIAMHHPKITMSFDPSQSTPIPSAIRSTAATARFRPLVKRNYHSEGATCLLHASGVIHLPPSKGTRHQKSPSDTENCNFLLFFFFENFYWRFVSTFCDWCLAFIRNSELSAALWRNETELTNGKMLISPDPHVFRPFVPWEWIKPRRPFRFLFSRM